MGYHFVGRFRSRGLGSPIVKYYSYMWSAAPVTTLHSPTDVQKKAIKFVGESTISSKHLLVPWFLIPPLAAPEIMTRKSFCMHPFTEQLQNFWNLQLLYHWSVNILEPFLHVFSCWSLRSINPNNFTIKVGFLYFAWTILHSSLWLETSLIYSTIFEIEKSRTHQAVIWIFIGLSLIKKGKDSFGWLETYWEKGPYNCETNKRMNYESIVLFDNNTV